MRAKSALAMLGVASLATPSCAMAYEGPEYVVVEKHGNIEVRDYAPYLVVETEVEAGFDGAGRRAFRRLAAYIGGANTSDTSIEMTVPVEQRLPGQRIEFNGPVNQTTRGDAYVVSFVIPSKFDAQTVPQPTDERLSIRKEPERRVVALRYSGFWSKSAYEERERQALEYARAEGYRPAGPAVYARYNDPFTLWFMRRNEVLVPVERRAQP